MCVDNHVKPWDKDQLSRLKRFYKNNIPINKIAIFMDRSSKAIRIKIMDKD
jgi:hypothetical protein